MKHCNEPMPPLVDYRPEVTPAVVAMMARMTAKAPSARYQTPGEIVTAARGCLESVRPGSPTGPTSGDLACAETIAAAPGGRRPGRAPRFRRWLLPGLAGAGVAVAGIGAALALRSCSGERTADHRLPENPGIRAALFQPRWTDMPVGMVLNRQFGRGMDERKNAAFLLVRDCVRFLVGSCQEFFSGLGDGEPLTVGGKTARFVSFDDGVLTLSVTGASLDLTLEEMRVRELLKLSADNLPPEHGGRHLATAFLLLSETDPDVLRAREELLLARRFGVEGVVVDRLLERFRNPSRPAPRRFPLRDRSRRPEKAM
jgi:hypothetical protein